MMWQTESLSPDATGWKIRTRFAHQNAAKQTVRRSRKRKEKALKPSGFKAFSVAGAEGLEVASHPLLRCPKKSSGYRFSAIFSTAAPTLAPFIRHRRRSQALPDTRFLSGCREKKNHPNSAVLRHLPPAKIVFDAVLMLLSFRCEKVKVCTGVKNLFCSRKSTLFRSKNMLS